MKNITIGGSYVYLTTQIKNDKNLVFTGMWKINFIPNFFLEIPQGYCKLFKPSCRNLDAYQHGKNQILSHSLLSWNNAKLCTRNRFHPSLIPWFIAKSLLTWYFRCFGHEWSYPSKLIVSTCRKFWYLSAWKKKSTLYLTSILKYYKNNENFLFWINWA